MGKKSASNQQQELQETVRKQQEEIQSLKEHLEKSETSRHKLREHLVLLKEKALNTGELIKQFQQLKSELEATKQTLEHEQVLRSQAEEALVTKTASYAHNSKLSEAGSISQEVRQLNEQLAAEKASRHLAEQQLKQAEQQLKQRGSSSSAPTGEVGVLTGSSDLVSSDIALRLERERQNRRAAEQHATQLNQQVHELELKCSQLLQQQQDLQSQLQQANRHSLDACNSTSPHVHGQHGRVAGDHSAPPQQLTDLQSAVKNLQQQLAAASSLREQLDSQVSSSEASRQQLQLDLQAAAAQSKELESKLSRASEQTQLAERKAHEMARAKERAEREVNGLHGQLQHLQAEVSALRSQVAEQQQLSTKVHGRVSEHGGQLVELQEAVRNASEQAAAARSHSEQLVLNMASVRVQQQLMQKIDQQQATIDLLVGEIRRYRTVFSAFAALGGPADVSESHDDDSLHLMGSAWPAQAQAALPAALPTPEIGAPSGTGRPTTGLREHTAAVGSSGGYSPDLGLAMHSHGLHQGSGGSVQRQQQQPVQHRQPAGVVGSGSGLVLRHVGDGGMQVNDAGTVPACDAAAPAAAPEGVACLVQEVPSGHGVESGSAAAAPPLTTNGSNVSNGPLASTPSQWHGESEAEEGSFSDMFQPCSPSHQPNTAEPRALQQHGQHRSAQEHVLDNAQQLVHLPQAEPVPQQPEQAQHLHTSSGQAVDDHAPAISGPVAVSEEVDEQPPPAKRVRRQESEHGAAAPSSSQQPDLPPLLIPGLTITAPPPVQHRGRGRPIKARPGPELLAPLLHNPRVFTRTVTMTARKINEAVACGGCPLLGVVAALESAIVECAAPRLATSSQVSEAQLQPPANTQLGWLGFHKPDAVQRGTLHWLVRCTWEADQLLAARERGVDSAKAWARVLLEASDSSRVASGPLMEMLLERLRARAFHGLGGGAASGDAQAGVGPALPSEQCALVTAYSLLCSCGGWIQEWRALLLQLLQPPARQAAHTSIPMLLSAVAAWPAALDPLGCLHPSTPAQPWQHQQVVGSTAVSAVSVAATQHVVWSGVGSDALSDGMVQAIRDLCSAVLGLAQSAVEPPPRTEQVQGAQDAAGSQLAHPQASRSTGPTSVLGAGNEQPGADCMQMPSTSQGSADQSRSRQAGQVSNASKGAVPSRSMSGSPHPAEDLAIAADLAHQLLQLLPPGHHREGPQQQRSAAGSGGVGWSGTLKALLGLVQWSLRAADGSAAGSGSGGTKGCEGAVLQQAASVLLLGCRRMDFVEAFDQVVRPMFSWVSSLTQRTDRVPVALQLLADVCTTSLTTNHSSSAAHTEEQVAAASLAVCEHMASHLGSQDGSPEAELALLQHGAATVLVSCLTALLSTGNGAAMALSSSEAAARLRSIARMLAAVRAWAASSSFDSSLLPQSTIKLMRLAKVLA